MILALLAASAGWATSAFDYTWSGPASGGTWQGQNWNGNTATGPISDLGGIQTATVYIGQGNVVTIGTGPGNTFAAAGTLTMAAGSQLVLPTYQNGQFSFEIASSLISGGDILVGGPAGGGLLTTGASNNVTSYQGATLDGGGTITLTNGSTVTTPYYGLDPAHNSVELINQTIRGDGLIAETNLVIDAPSKIDANHSGLTLLMNQAGGNGVVTNNGVMQASNGGILQLGGGHWGGGPAYVTQAAGGLIQALDGSLVQLGYSNAGNYDIPGSITGGTLSTSGTGRIDGRDYFLLDGVTNAGDLHAVYTGVANANGIQLANGINNTGSITLDIAVSNSVALSIVSGGATLTGGGKVILNGTANAIIGGPLTNVGNTIQGAGGVSLTTLVNQSGGVVNANQSGATLLFYGGGTVQNSGILEASKGGTLQLGGGHNGGGPVYVTQSSGGLIQALDGSLVQLGYSNAGNYDVAGSITGGTLSTSGTGRIDGRDYFLLDGVTNTGDLHAVYTGNSNANGIQLANTINNTGSITLDSAGSNSVALSVVSGGATLTGGGKVILNGTANGIIGGPLTNVDNKIQGAGGIALTTFINQSGGVVNANHVGDTMVFYGGGTVQNSGVLEASNGGTLQLGGGHWSGGPIFINQTSGGVIQALDGSLVQLGYSNPGNYDSPGSITGGTLATSGSGRIDARDYFLLDSVTNTGDLHVVYTSGSNDNRLRLANTIGNTGTITLDSAGIYLEGDVTLTGSGTVNLNGYGISGGLLTNNGNTIQGSGTVDWMNNQGTVHVAAGDGMGINTLANVSGGTLTGGTYIVAGTLAISGQITNNAASITLDGASSRMGYSTSDALAPFANNLAAGSFTIQNGRNFTTADNFTNAGTMNIGSGTTFQVGPAGSGTYTQTAGSTKLNGTLTAGSLNIAGGTLSGAGTLNAGLIVSGTLSPGNSPGTIVVNGSYTQTGTLDIEVAMGLADELIVNGNVNLGGILDVTTYGTWSGSIDKDFLILSWTGSRSGSFDQIFLPTLAGYQFSTEWAANGLYLDVTGNGPTSGTPEPTTAAFLLIGAVVLMGSYKLRRNR
jgi:hypothetical protein